MVGAVVARGAAAAVLETGSGTLAAGFVTLVSLSLRLPNTVLLQTGGLLAP
jgi:hypothetical protein